MGLVRLPLLLAVLTAGPARAQEAPEYMRKQDVIYGRKFGLALTMDVFAPAKPNGAAVVSVASGGWVSRPEMIQPALYVPFLKRGYTVFAVLPGHQPKLTLPRIVWVNHR